MKPFLTITIMTTLVSTLAFAQSKKEVKEIEAAVEQLRVAMINGNRESLADVAADDLSYGHSGGHVENKGEFIEKIASGKSDFVSIELSNQTIKIVDNAAIVRHDLAAVTSDGGKQGNVNLHILTVWQRQRGKWKMLARQAVKLTH